MMMMEEGKDTGHADKWLVILEAANYAFQKKPFSFACLALTRISQCEIAFHLPLQY